MTKLSKFDTICDHGNVELTCAICDRIRDYETINSLKEELDLVRTKSKIKVKALRDKGKAMVETMAGLEGQLNRLYHEQKPMRESLNRMTAEHSKMTRKLKRLENRK